MKTINYFLITALALGMGIATAYSQVPTNGIVAYYPFSGSANDDSGNGINGTPSSGYISSNTPPLLTADRLGNANSAYDFQPSTVSSAYIDLGQPAQFNFGTSTSFSIALWMKYQVYQVSATMFSNSAWHLGIRNLSGNDHLNFVVGGGDFISDIIMQDSAWIHVAGVYNQSAETMEMYINGVLATGYPWNNSLGGPSVPALSTTGMGIDATPTGTTQIGQSGIYPSTGIKGIIDEVILYNRALSAGEVASIAAATGGPSAIAENSDKGIFSVSPNPSTGIFHVQYSNVNSNVSKLNVYSIDGRLVLSHSNIGTNADIDLSSFDSGIYFMTLETSNGILTQKVNIAK